LCPLILRYAVKYKSEVEYEFSRLILIYICLIIRMIFLVKNNSMYNEVS
jgi:hypothetical protein